MPSSQVNDGLFGTAKYGGIGPRNPSSWETTAPIAGWSPKAEPNLPERTQFVAVSWWSFP